MKKRNCMVMIKSDGFVFIDNGTEKASFLWSSIYEVTAYKLDLVTTDEVRLRFNLDASPFSIEVSEDMDGFENFKSTAEKQFQFPDGWWSRVLQPAFATNEHVLYRRTMSQKTS